MTPGASGSREKIAIPDPSIGSRSMAEQTPHSKKSSHASRVDQSPSGIVFVDDNQMTTGRTLHSPKATKMTAMTIATEEDEHPPRIAQAPEAPIVTKEH